MVPNAPNFTVAIATGLEKPRKIMAGIENKALPPALVPIKLASTPIKKILIDNSIGSIM